jgi:hypothetical protein
MSVSIHGDFAIHRTKDANGKDAILLVPERFDLPLLYGAEDSDGLCEISFERVEGGGNPPDSYLTITYPDGGKVHFGPDIVLSRTKN